MSDLKQIIKDRMEQLEITPYNLAIAYGKIVDPNLSDVGDRDIGNKYLSSVKRAINDPESCKVETLKAIVQALQGNLIFQVEFFDKKVHRLTA